MNGTSGSSIEVHLKDPTSRRQFRRALLGWYESNKRDLPWRVSRDPYRVWVSEIMLQQTRVAAVIAYYERFLNRFPTVQKLAAARLDSVLAAWSGLGYYRRARFMHAAAKQVVHDLHGRWPCSAEEWRKLPGIGRYTAAAIASIACQQPAAVVDGNVERVLSRIAGMSLTAEGCWSLAQQLVPAVRPGDFNQAVMELGATVCLPRGPKCPVCPVQALCSTRGELAAAQAAKRQKREIHYNLNLRDGAVLLRRRSRKASLMAGMWELPEIAPADANGATVLKLRHSITVTDYVVRVSKHLDSPLNGGRWFPQSRVSQLPLTGLTRKILLTTGVI